MLFMKSAAKMKHVLDFLLPLFPNKCVGLPEKVLVELATQTLKARIQAILFGDWYDFSISATCAFFMYVWLVSYKSEDKCSTCT
jgi:hypothetical protein